MTRRLNNILLTSAQNTDLKETILSIQIYLDGFSFSIYHFETNKYLAFERFEFKEKKQTPEKLLTKFKTAFEENELLQQQYRKVIVIHQNELATIVPLELFDENNLKDYLNNTIKVLPIDYISYDTLTEIDAAIVYIPFVNINNFLFQKFGTFDFYHSFTLLCDTLLAKQKNSNLQKVYVNVNDDNFELIIFDKGELLLLNSFNFQTADDFIYYILFALEQFNLDVNTIYMELLGDIEKDSELFAIAYKYIRNIDFYKESNSLISSEFDNLSKHANFILLNNTILI